MENFKFYIFSLLIYLAFSSTILKTFPAFFSPSYFYIGNVPASTTVRFNIVVLNINPSGSSINYNLKRDSSSMLYGVTSDRADMVYNNMKAGTFVLYIYSYKDAPTFFNLTISDGSTNSSFFGCGTSSSKYDQIFFFNATTTYSQVTLTSSYTNIDSYKIFPPSKLPVSNISSNFITYTGPFKMNETGTYIISIVQKPSDNRYSQYMNFDVFLTDTTCGNFIKEYFQECDNGNQVGCIGCKVDQAYSCGGDQTKTPCTCLNSSLVFNFDTLQCNINCSNVKNALGIKYLKTDECQCLPNFSYDKLRNKCLPDCINAPLSTGPSIDNPEECLCPIAYYFSQKEFSCILNCSIFTGSIGYTLNKQSCYCPQNFYLDISKQACVVNCSLEQNSNGPANGTNDECICQDGYTWNSKKCQSICGDGIKTNGEQCDDGNNQNNDQCSNICLMTSMGVPRQVQIKQIKKEGSFMSPLEIGLLVGVSLTTLLSVALIVFHVIKSSRKEVPLPEVSGRKFECDTNKSPDIGIFHESK